MSNSTNIISNIVTQKIKENIIGLIFSYFYLLLGVFLMFIQLFG